MIKIANYFNQFPYIWHYFFVYASEFKYLRENSEDGQYRFRSYAKFAQDMIRAEEVNLRKGY